MGEERSTETFDCKCPPSPALVAGVCQFNDGEYFACHETLEELWLAEKGLLRGLYQGILQVGVGLYHLQRGNERGALILLARGTELLRPFTPCCLGIDVAALVGDAEEVLQTLQAFGLQRTQVLAPGLFPRIRLVRGGGGEEETGERGRGAARA
jgi:uncharacterized protein